MVEVVDPRTRQPRWYRRGELLPAIRLDGERSHLSVSIVAWVDRIVSDPIATSDSSQTNCNNRPSPMRLPSSFSI